MDNDTTAFQMTAAVHAGDSGGPVLDGAGNLLGVTVARINDVAVLAATATVPQSVNFVIKGDIAASFLRVNGVEPKTSAEALALQIFHWPYPDCSSHSGKSVRPPPSCHPPIFLE